MANPFIPLLAIAVTNYGLTKGWTATDVENVFFKAKSVQMENFANPRLVVHTLDKLYQEVLKEKTDSIERINTLMKEIKSVR